MLISLIYCIFPCISLQDSYTFLIPVFIFIIRQLDTLFRPSLHSYSFKLKEIILIDDTSCHKSCRNSFCRGAFIDRDVTISVFLFIILGG